MTIIRITFEKKKHKRTAWMMENEFLKKQMKTKGLHENPTSTHFKILKTFIKKGNYSYWPPKNPENITFLVNKRWRPKWRGRKATLPSTPVFVHNWPTKIYINSNNNLQFIYTNFKRLLDFIVHLP